MMGGTRSHQKAKNREGTKQIFMALKKTKLQHIAKYFLFISFYGVMIIHHLNYIGGH